MNPNSFIVIRRKDRYTWFGYTQEQDDKALDDSFYPGFCRVRFTRAQLIDSLARMLYNPIHVGV